MRFGLSDRPRYLVGPRGGSTEAATPDQSAVGVGSTVAVPA
jgi:hypothetical protein